MVGVLLLLFCTYEGCSGRTMMTVSNIERRHLGKLLCDGLHISLVRYYPELVAETIDRGNEIVFGLSGSIAHNQIVEYAIIGIGKEYWFDIGIVYTHMLHTIFFLIATGKLMFFDAASHIVIGMGTYHKAILRFSVHRLRIYIIMFARVLNQPTLILELLEILCGLLVHTRIIL